MELIDMIRGHTVEKCLVEKPAARPTAPPIPVVPSCLRTWAAPVGHFSISSPHLRETEDL